jgi:hypothetical protein
MTFLDSNRQDFIGTTCGLGDGETIERKRDRQVHTSHNALPSKVIIDVPQPLMISQYHEYVGNVNFHNRVRQSYLGLEYILTKDWSKRANLNALTLRCQRSRYEDIEKEHYWKAAATPMSIAG